MTITKRHLVPDGWRKAVYSDCELYRFSLTVLWDRSKPRLLYVMLNPSQATELANDPTIERCERRARMLGYGAFAVVNLFALRETSPLRLKAAKNPEGAENTMHIERAAAWANDILVAWGAHGEHRNICDSVLPILRASDRRLLHLGLTKAGHPRHPLYISYKKQPEVWS